jgi:selenocysteine-specific translation elongation factor
MFGEVVVKDIFNITGVGVVVVVEVISGVIRKGSAFRLPSGKTGMVKSIEMLGRSIEVAKTGMKVGIALSGVSKEDLRKGDIILIR